MVKTTLFLTDRDVAMMEHDFISDSHPLELEQDSWRYYIAGAHDFAQAVIEAIRKEGE